MKNLLFNLVCLVLFFTGTTLFAVAEENSPARAVTEIRNVSPFNGVDAGGAFSVIIRQGSPQEVKVTAEEGVISKINTEVRNQILFVTGSSLRNPGKMLIEITVPELVYLNASGASTFRTEGDFNSKEFLLKVSGAANVVADIRTSLIRSDISGAADVKLSGKANRHESEISGAASLKAFDFETDTLSIDLSGAADARVDVKKAAFVNKSGVASIRYKSEPPSINVGGPLRNTDFEEGRMKGMVNVGGDSIVVDLGKVKVKRDEEEGISTIKLGRQKLIVDDEGNVRLKRENNNRPFEGHWGGFDLSFNGYLNSDGNMDFTGADRYLDLYMPKSIGVHLNIYEQNVNMGSSGHFGFITGLGLEWHNYRFNRGIYLDENAEITKGYLTQGVKIEKNKLVVSYLSLPLLIEFQNRGEHKLGDFHVAAGALLGARLGSHTKTVFMENQKEYQLIDPATNEVWKTVVSPREDTEKVYNDFNLNPFKVDAMVRVGWGYINLFGTYSLTTLFRSNKGPELYPFSIGLTLIGW
ncbi:MAG: GIN domain-containing protein [Bacteroidales bacterium]